jgi:tetratricopeptide (TPR) repeat protein
MKGIVNRGLMMALLASSAAAQTNKSGQSVLLKTGIAQYEAEKLDEAKATLTPLAKAGDPEAMFYLGRVAIEQSDGDEAVTWLEEAAKKNDRSSVYHQWLATAYAIKAAAASPMAQMTLLPALKRESERAVELDSTNIDARVNLMQFYFQAPAMMGGGPDKAGEQLTAIMALNPYQGRLQSASAAEGQKDSATAERTLRDLTTAYPDSSTPAVRLGTYYANQKRYDDAFRVLEDRLRKSPNDGSALYQLGRAGALSGTKLDQAQSALNRYLKMPHKRGTPTIAAAHWRLGMVVEAKGDTKTAKAEYERALRLDPKLTEAKASLDKLSKGGS